MSHEERALFVSESQEYLQILNNGLLQLEQGTDPEVVAELFRAAHSLKGMAATLGEQGVVGLTHAMEEFLSRVRETGEQLAAEDLDLLLAACDGLEAWLAAVQKGDEATMAQAQEGLETLEASVRAGFQRLLGREQTAASQVETAAPGQTSAGDLPLELNLYDQELIQEATRQGLQATDLFIRLDPGCRMKSVRVFLIFRALEQVGRSSSPSRPRRSWTRSASTTGSGCWWSPRSRPRPWPNGCGAWLRWPRWSPGPSPPGRRALDPMGPRAPGRLPPPGSQPPGRTAAPACPRSWPPSGTIFSTSASSGWM